MAIVREYFTGQPIPHATPKDIAVKQVSAYPNSEQPDTLVRMSGSIGDILVITSFRCEKDTALELEYRYG